MNREFVKDIKMSLTNAISILYKITGNIISILSLNGQTKGNVMNETIPIKTDDNHLYCDACGYEIHQEDKICEHCKREIDWNK